MAERDLYPAVQVFLELRFRDRVKPIYGDFRSISAIVATAGGGGTWTWSKPDLCLLALWRQKYSPAWQLDLHGFEVKTDEGCTPASVHEALNHTSFVHYAHLVWQVAQWDDLAPRCKAILERCARYGVGLITFARAEDASDYVVRLSGRRHEPAGDAVDEFIESRFPPDEKQRFEAWLKEIR